MSLPPFKLSEFVEEMELTANNRRSARTPFQLSRLLKHALTVPRSYIGGSRERAGRFPASAFCGSV